MQRMLNPLFPRFSTSLSLSLESPLFSSPSSFFSRPSLRIGRHIYRQEPNLLPNSTTTRIIVRFQRMPAHNQIANTAGNADPDNSTDDRFWHRSQRGRGNTDTVDMLYQRSTKVSNKSGRRERERERGSSFFNRMSLWIHLWRSIGFTIFFIFIRF